MTIKAESSHISPDAVIREIGNGRLYPCYLIYGDDEFLVRDASHKIIDLLIPAADRDLNLFSISGEDVDADSLSETLITSPLLPGRKVVVVRRAPFFYSRQTSADMIQKVREHLENDPLRAAREFMAFLAVAGWNLDDLKDDGWKKIRDEEWLSLVDGDSAGQREQWLPKVIRLSIQHGLLARKTVDDADQLVKTLVSGLPEGHFLILTASVVDKRKRLYKTISEIGRIITFPQIKGEARQRGQMIAATRELLAASGKSLTDEAWTLLGKKTGFDLQNSASALEKLIVHAGDRSVIDEKDVAGLIGKTKEDTVFNLTAALAEKNVARSLKTLNELMVRGNEPLMILAMLTREVRMLLQGRILLMHGPLGEFDARMDYNAFQGRVHPKIKAMAAPSTDSDRAIELTGQHPYVVYNTLKNASRFSFEALIACLEALATTDIQMKTTARNPRLLLERLILTACSS